MPHLTRHVQCNFAHDIEPSFRVLDLNVDSVNRPRGLPLDFAVTDYFARTSALPGLPSAGSLQTTCPLPTKLAKLQIICSSNPFERARFYLDVNDFQWNLNYDHQFLFLHTALVFFCDSRLAFVRPVLLSLISYGCSDGTWRVRFWFLLYTVYHGVPSNFAKPTDFCGVRFALLSLSPAFPILVRQRSSLTNFHESKYDASQSLAVFDHLTCFNWSALSDADLGGKPCVYCNLETSTASTPL